MTDTTTDILLDELLAFRAQLPADQRGRFPADQRGRFPADQRGRFTALIKDALVNYAALSPEQKTRVLQCLTQKFSTLHNDNVLYFTCGYNQ